MVSYEKKFGELVENKTIISESHYNDFGFLVSGKRYDSEGNALDRFGLAESGFYERITDSSADPYNISRLIRSYDESRRIISERKYLVRLNQLDQPGDTVYYSYNTNGDLIHKDYDTWISDFKKTICRLSYEYEYSADGSLLSKRTTDEKIEKRYYDEKNPKGKFSEDVLDQYFPVDPRYVFSDEIERYEYYDSGALRTLTQNSIRTNPDGTISEEPQDWFLYDEEGTIIEKKRFSTWSGSLEVTHDFFDLQGRETRRDKFVDGELVSSRILIETEYNSENLPSRETTYNYQGGITRMDRFYYDDQNRIANKVIYDGDGKQMLGLQYSYGDSFDALVAYRDEAFQSPVYGMIFDNAERITGFFTLGISAGISDFVDDTLVGPLLSSAYSSYETHRYFEVNYADNNQLESIQIRYTSNGPVREVFEYEYDSFDNLVAETYSALDNLTGNLERQMQYLRELEYFN